MGRKIYKPSAKIKIIIIPVNNRGWSAFALTPTSPITPIHMPAPNPENPTARPPPKWANPLNGVYVSLSTVQNR